MNRHYDKLSRNIFNKKNRRYSNPINVVVSRKKKQGGYNKVSRKKIIEVHEERGLSKTNKNIMQKTLSLTMSTALKIEIVSLTQETLNF